MVIVEIHGSSRRVARMFRERISRRVVTNFDKKVQLVIIPREKVYDNLTGSLCPPFFRVYGSESEVYSGRLIGVLRETGLVLQIIYTH